MIIGVKYRLTVGVDVVLSLGRTKSSKKMLLLCCLVYSMFACFTAFADAVPFTDTDTLEQIQQKIEQNGYSFTVAPNHIFNMTPEQRKKLLNRRFSSGTPKGKNADDIGPLKNFLGKTSLETAFSWTDYNGHSYIGPIRNQGNCGSCYAFGACDAAEGAYNVTRGLYDDNCVDFSEAFLAFCLGSLPAYFNHFSGCDGSDYDYYELQSLVDYGVCLESAYPYVDSDPGSCSYWNKPRVKFDDWYRVTCGDVTAIKTAIRNFGVVDAAVDATGAFDAYESGVYEDSETTCPDGAYTETNHAIGLVGWDDNPPEGGGGCWILRNSWGDDWGEGGYMRIRYKSARVSCSVTYITYSYTPPVAPIVTTGTATDLTSSSVMLNGSVNPKGSETTYYFEYGTTTSYGSVTSSVSAGSGSNAISVNASIIGLQSYTKYHFRLVASNEGGETKGDDATFTTPSSQTLIPKATTGAATRPAYTAIVMNGVVNARSSSTTCYFEYGLDENYGSTMTAATGSGGTVVTGASDTSVQAYLWGTPAGTTYHYRLCAVNSRGTTVGSDATFTTAALPDGAKFVEDFEHKGALSSGWSQEQASGSASWVFVDGNNKEPEYPERSYSGLYNAYLFSNSGAVTRLISPSIDLSSAANPVLSFWQCMAVWGDDQDTLRVVCRDSANGSWTELAYYNSSIAEWTKQSIPISSTSSTFQFAFEGKGLFGYGVAIDDPLIIAEGMAFREQPRGGWFEEGTPLTLSVSVVGTVGEVSYLWMKNGELIADATDSTYSFGALESDNTGSYSCRASDSAKTTITSVAAYVRVIEPGVLPGASNGALLACTFGIAALGAAMLTRGLANRGRGKI
jgi:C1A family cysteine protease